MNLLAGKSWANMNGSFYDIRYSAVHVKCNDSKKNSFELNANTAKLP
jgi:hypothetical protein